MQPIPHFRRTHWLGLAVSMGLSMLLAWGACGPKEKPRVVKPRPTDDTFTTERPKPKDDGLVVKGLLGKLDLQDVDKAFRAKASEIQQCLDTHIKALRYVSGEIGFFFIIKRDGTPEKVDVTSTTIGNYQADACLHNIAKSLRFVKPEGGKAHVSYKLPIHGDAQPGGTWEKDKVDATIKTKQTEIDACKMDGKPSSFTLTFYIWPGGKVKSMGVHAVKDLPATFPKCVADILMPVDFPDPLGKVVKVSAEY